MPSNVSYPGVYVEEVPAGFQAISGVPTSICAFIGRAAQGPVNQAVTIFGFNDFLDRFGAAVPDMPLGPAVHLFFENGGTTAIIVRIAAPDASPADAAPADPANDPAIAPASDDAAIIGDPAAHSGLYALDTVERFNLLCLPPLGLGRDLAPETWATAALYCRRRKAILLIDPPLDWSRDRAAVLTATQAGVIALRRAVTGPAASHAALYFPSLLLTDPSAAAGRLFPPCGAIAGIIARNDAEHGVWRAPAGLHTAFAGGLAFAVHLTDGETALLNPLGLNCLRSFPGHGDVIWGARTLAGTDAQVTEWKYLPVQRFALFLEDSIAQGTTWAVFEANGEALWAKLRNATDNFLLQLFRQGAFRGTKPDEAYFVLCDRSTMTQDEINQGIVNIVIGFAPLKPAEFVVLALRHLVGQSAH